VQHKALTVHGLAAVYQDILEAIHSVLVLDMLAEVKTAFHPSFRPSREKNGVDKPRSIALQYKQMRLNAYVQVSSDTVKSFAGLERSKVRVRQGNRYALPACRQEGLLPWQDRQGYGFVAAS